MRIIMQLKWDGVSQTQYDDLRKTVNWEGDVPKGALFHTAGFNQGGICVTDVWESEEDFNNFAHSRLMAGTQQVGIAGAPQIDIYPVHATFIPTPALLS